MAEQDLFIKTLTALIKNQIATAGKDVTLGKIHQIKGLQIKMDGTVEAITGNVNEVLQQVLSAFTDPNSKTTAEAVIEAKSQQAAQLKEKIESGWKEVSEEKAQLTGALESLLLGYIQTDANMKVVYQNPAVARILGKSEAETWDLDEIQDNLSSGFMLKIEGEKAMKIQVALPPHDAEFKNKKLRFFISPIKIYKKTIESVGVAILVEDLTKSESN